MFLYKQCRTEQSAARQRQLLEGMLEAMLQQQYDEITVSSLCEKMEIPRKSFYRYFSSKEGALNALIDQTLLDYEVFTASFPENSVQEELSNLFVYWHHQKILLDALQKSGLSGVLVTRAIDHSLMESIGSKRSLTAEEQDAREYMTLFGVSGFLSMVIQWHHNGYRQTVQQMVQIALRLMSNPLAVDL